MSSRTVLIPIDHSEHSEKAFDCEYCVYIIMLLHPHVCVMSAQYS